MLFARSAHLEAVGLDARRCVGHYDPDFGMQLEQAQGCVDLQARAQLDRLRQQTAALSEADRQAQHQVLAPPQAIDELAIAGQLDK